MKKNLITIIATMLALGAFASAFTYQGALQDPSGNALTEGATIVFRLYDEAKGSTSACLWAHRCNVVLDDKGYFNAEISDSYGTALDIGTPGAPAVAYTLDQVLAMQKNKTLYIGLQVGDSGEIAPRQKILAVPAATYAQNVSQATGDFRVNGNLEVDGTFAVGAAGGKQMTFSATSGLFEVPELSAGTTKVSAFSANQDGRFMASVDIDQNLNVDGKADVGGNLKVGGAVSCSALTVNGMSPAVPVGVIVMWYGSSDAVPEGWAICDGRTTENDFVTPDLSGRFVIGAGGSRMDKNRYSSTAADGGSSYNMGATGGSRTVKLEDVNIPNHSHNWVGDDQLEGIGSGYDASEKIREVGGYDADSGRSGNAKVYRTSTWGGSNGNTVPHENLPPYMALFYIVKYK